MPVTKDASGQRSVFVEVEVPGTPEEVWRAIASGPGITSWFVPTEMEEQLGGKAVSSFGPDMDSVSTITEWSPPHRFTAKSQDDLGPGSPVMATEWIVEARGNGACVVRVVHNWVSESDEWDRFAEQTEHGWTAAFRILRLYLTHFAGQPSAAIQFMGLGSGSRVEAWEELVGSLGLAKAGVGEQVQTSADAPRLSGLVKVQERPNREGIPDEMLLCLEEPTTGIAHLFVLPMGGKIFLPVRLFLYGDQAAATAEREKPVWEAWLNQHFPNPPAAEASA